MGKKGGIPGFNRRPACLCSNLGIRVPEGLVQKINCIWPNPALEPADGRKDEFLRGRLGKIVPHGRRQKGNIGRISQKIPDLSLQIRIGREAFQGKINLGSKNRNAFIRLF